MTQVAIGPDRRGRGRPPRLSRERIVEGAVEVLLAEPAVSLTIKRVADAVGAAPMALYRYFPDRDALLQATADHVLEAMERAPIADGPGRTGCAPGCAPGRPTSAPTRSSCRT